MAEVIAEKWYRGEKVLQLGRRGKWKARVRRADGTEELLPNEELLDTEAESAPELAFGLVPLLRPQEEAILSAASAPVPGGVPPEEAEGLEPSLSRLVKVFGSSPAAAEAVVRERPEPVVGVSHVVGSLAAFHSGVDSRDESEEGELPLEESVAFLAGGLTLPVSPVLASRLVPAGPKTLDESGNVIGVDLHAVAAERARRSKASRMAESVRSQESVREHRDESRPRTSGSYPNHPKKL